MLFGGRLRPTIALRIGSGTRSGYAPSVLAAAGGISGTVLTVDTFSVTGLDTTNTGYFASGSGVGTAQKLSTWLDIPQVLTVSSSGGDARFTDISPLAKRNSIKVPTGFNATAMTLTLGHDASQANYITMLGISRNLSKVAIKQVISGGAVTYGYGYMSVSENPKLNVNQANTVDAALTILGRTVSY